jgi:hypothetical protein
MGVRTQRTILAIAVVSKKGNGKSDFCAAKKGRKKSNPGKQSFARLSKKLD